MMDRTTTMFGKKKKTTSSSSSSSNKKKKPTTVHPRNPLTDLNTTSTSSSSSSSVLIEARRGCLGFLLPNNSSPKPLPHQNTKSKTPKSAPNPKISAPKLRSKNPTLHQVRKPNIFGKNQSFKPPDPVSLSKPSADLEEAHVNGISVEILGSGSCCFEDQESEAEKKKKKQWSFSRKGVSTELKSFSFEKTCLDDDNHLTTPVNKLSFESRFDSINITNTATATATTTTTTPPIEASLSPEIQCQSSLNLNSTTTPPTCFGAGHVLSGVTDKRKCRPRGILTVGEELGVCEDGVASAHRNASLMELVNSCGFSLVPSPTEASVQWILSPCKEEDNKDSPPNESPEFRSLAPTPFQSLSSPSSGYGFSSDALGNSKNTSNASSAARSCLVSSGEYTGFGGFMGCTPPVSGVRPCHDRVVSCSSSSPATSDCEAVAMSNKGTGYRYELATENSPLSADSLSSHNVICTPESGSSMDRLVKLSWLKNVDDEKEQQLQLDSVTEVLSRSTLSPKNRTSMWDPADVLPLPGFSFQFTHANSPSNAEMKLQKTVSDKLLGVSSSGCQSSSLSQMRISWREGLVSRIFEMDELDCCRCLSDEEEDIRLSGHYPFEADDCELKQTVRNSPTLTDSYTSAHFESEKFEIDKKKEVKLPQELNSCAESISTDGGGLLASGDSDWSQCYKNQLFDGTRRSQENGCGWETAVQLNVKTRGDDRIKARIQLYYIAKVPGLSLSYQRHCCNKRGNMVSKVNNMCCLCLILVVVMLVMVPYESVAHEAGGGELKSRLLCSQCSKCDVKQCPASDAYPHMTAIDNTLIASALQSDYVGSRDRGVYSVPSVIGGESKQYNAYYGWKSTSGSASDYHRFSNYMDKCSGDQNYLSADEHGNVGIRSLKSLKSLAQADWKSINPPEELNHREFRFWVNRSNGKCLTVFGGKGKSNKRVVGVADCKLNGSNHGQLFAFRFHYHKAFCCCGLFNQ